MALTARASRVRLRTANSAASLETMIACSVADGAGDLQWLHGEVVNKAE